MSWENDDFVPEGMAPLPPYQPPVIPDAEEHLTPAQQEEIQQLRQQGYIQTSPENLTEGRQYSIFHALRGNRNIRVTREDRYTYTGRSQRMGELQLMYYTFRLYDTPVSYSESSFTERDLFFELPGQRGGKRRSRKGSRKSRKGSKSRKGRKTRSRK